MGVFTWEVQSAFILEETPTTGKRCGIESARLDIGVRPRVDMVSLYCKKGGCVCVVCAWVLCAKKDLGRVIGSGFSCCRHTAMSLCVQSAGVRVYQCTAGSTQSGTRQGGKGRKCEWWCVKFTLPRRVLCVVSLLLGDHKGENVRVISVVVHELGPQIYDLG